MALLLIKPRIVSAENVANRGYRPRLYFYPATRICIVTSSSMESSAADCRALPNAQIVFP